MSDSLPAAELQRRLALLRVAKDVFLSDWYLRASDALVSAEGRATLRQVAAESEKERDAALALVEEWAARDADGEAEARAIHAVHAAMARDFLDGLVAMKQSSADVLQKVAALAPEDLRVRFFELANADLAHAMALRRLVLHEFPDPGELFLGSQRQYPEPAQMAAARHELRP